MSGASDRSCSSTASSRMEATWMTGTPPSPAMAGPVPATTTGMRSPSDSNDLASGVASWMTKPQTRVSVCSRHRSTVPEKALSLPSISTLGSLGSSLLMFHFSLHAHDHPDAHATLPQCSTRARRRSARLICPFTRPFSMTGKRRKREFMKSSAALMISVPESIVATSVLM